MLVNTKKELIEIIEERLQVNRDSDFNDLDVREITDMSNLFRDLSPRNIKVIIS